MGGGSGSEMLSVALHLRWCKNSGHKIETTTNWLEKLSQGGHPLYPSLHRYNAEFSFFFSVKTQMCRHYCPLTTATHLLCQAKLRVTCASALSGRGLMSRVDIFLYGQSSKESSHRVRGWRAGQGNRPLEAAQICSGGVGGIQLRILAAIMIEWQWARFENIVWIIFWGN